MSKVALTKEEIKAYSEAYLRNTITSEQLGALSDALTGNPDGKMKDYFNDDELYMVGYMIEWCAVMGNDKAGKDSHRADCDVATSMLRMIEDLAGRAAFITALGVILKSSIQELLMLGFPGMTAPEAVAYLREERANHQADGDKNPAK